jgi:hypothetical protein
MLCLVRLLVIDRKFSLAIIWAVDPKLPFRSIALVLPHVTSMTHPNSVSTNPALPWVMSHFRDVHTVNSSSVNPFAFTLLGLIPVNQTCIRQWPSLHLIQSLWLWCRSFSVGHVHFTRRLIKKFKIIRIGEGSNLCFTDSQGGYSNVYTACARKTNGFGNEITF